REIGGTVGTLGRLHAEEHDLGALRCGGGSDHEFEPARREALLDQLGQTELQDRNFAFFQARDPLGVDVRTMDIVPEVREARGSSESDVPGPDDRDPHGTPRPRPDMRRKSRGRRAFSAAQQPTSGPEAEDAPPAAEPPDARAPLDAGLDAGLVAVAGATRL